MLKEARLPLESLDLGGSYIFVVGVPESDELRSAGLLIKGSCCNGLELCHEESNGLGWCLGEQVPQRKLLWSCLGQSHKELQRAINNTEEERKIEEV